MGLDRCYGIMHVLPVDIDSDGWTDLLLTNGGLDSQRVEPSVVLRNLQGQRFQEWYYVPGFGRPGNFTGAAIVGFERDGAHDVYLAQNSILRDRFSSDALFLQLRVQEGSHNPTLQDNAPNRRSP
jgi:hypothetical protein